MRSCQKIFLLIGLLAALCAALLTSAQSITAKPPQFPRLTSYSLDKTRLNLPGDFAGQVNLLLLSFRPEQQKQVDSWMPAAQALQHIYSKFHWYQLPVSSRENFVFRWWDNSSMRSDETDPATWPWIVPVYVDKNSFRRKLQIPTELQISVLLVDKQGTVLWRSNGPMTPEKRDSLKTAVEAAIQ